MRPSAYKRPFTVMQEVPYTMIEGGVDNALAQTGKLAVGRVVWLPESETNLTEAKVVAFAEGLGTIAVSRNSIADVSQHN